MTQETAQAPAELVEALVVTGPLDPDSVTAPSARCLPGSTDGWIAPTDPVVGLRNGIAVAVGIAGIVAGPASHILVGRRTSAPRNPAGGV